MSEPSSSRRAVENGGTVSWRAIRCTAKTANRLAGSKDLASRAAARTEALDWLKAVARNEEQVVPYGADEQIAGGQSPKINPRVRTFGRFQEEGI